MRTEVEPTRGDKTAVEMRAAGGPPAGMGPDRGTQAAAGKGLRGPPTAGGRDPTSRAWPGQGQLLPARGGPRPR